jgi:hypothetical protein
MLTKEHKSKRMAALLEILCHYQDEGESFMEIFIMGYGFTSSPQSQKETL